MSEDNPWDDIRLNVESPVPLWVQLGRELRRCIAEHGLKVGSLLPSEQRLVVTYLGLTAVDAGRAYSELASIGQIEGNRSEGYRVAEELPLEYVTVMPGSKISAPASHDPHIKSNLPWWAVVALRVETPGMEPVYFDSTRTVLCVA